MLKKLVIPALICLPAAAQAGGSVAEITYQSCRVCHDTAPDATIPPLAGRSAEDLTAAFAEMAGDLAAQTIMHRFTSGLSAEELADLVSYIATVKGSQL